MKHCFRFFGNYIKRDSNFEWTITGEELRHMHSVLRLQEGDTIEVFNGEGFYCLAKIESLKPKKQAIAISEQLCFSEKPKGTLALAIGALKPKTFDDLLPCLVELGLDEIHVFAQRHTEKFRISDKSKERWEKIVLGATKQSKRNYLCKLKTWQKPEGFIEHLKENFDRVLLLDPEAKNKLAGLQNKEQKLCAIIGSESGLSKEELESFKDIKAEGVRLGKNILRAYTAAIATTTILSCS